MLVLIVSVHLPDTVNVSGIFPVEIDQNLYTPVGCMQYILTLLFIMNDYSSEDAKHESYRAK